MPHLIEKLAVLCCTYLLPLLLPVHYFSEHSSHLVIVLGLKRVIAHLFCINNLDNHLATGNKNTFNIQYIHLYIHAQPQVAVPVNVVGSAMLLSDVYEGISAGASKESRATTSPLIINGKVHLPFQLQIRYTDQDGSRCMRVSTIAKPVISNKDTAEKSEYTY